MARQPRGGTYVMDNESFGRMMLSEQLRPPLSAVSRLVAGQAKANTVASSGEGPLANGYTVERGPAVVVKGQTGIPGPRISQRVVNRLRYAAAREFGRGGFLAGRGTRDLRRAGAAYGDLAGDPR